MRLKYLYGRNGKFWSAKHVFGATAGAEGQKVLNEAIEFAEEPSLKEAADVLISTMSWCFNHGYSWGEVVDAISEKMHINFDRNWKKMEDGTWQHT